jgi:hypothetical protein
MTRLVAMVINRIAPVRRAGACDPFEHCGFYDEQMCPYDIYHIKGCCPTGCACC